ncbi:MAG: hypothetical protein IKJ23_00690 [Bacteroidaceae bacterium]|nr:hypothetical protein [Bacteroidaceae bacterium]
MTRTKKDYFSPEIHEYDVLPSYIICISGIVAGGSDDDDVDEEDALSNRHRNDWENIWANM